MVFHSHNCFHAVEVDTEPVSWNFLVWFSLQEGSYLLSHAAEDSSLLIYKTSDGKVTRTAYNLHKTHCGLPGVPSSLSVPWVPLDPSLLLPYHIHHGRIPCTFPPKSLGPTPQQKVRSFLQLNVALGGLLFICVIDNTIFQLHVHINHNII